MQRGKTKAEIAPGGTWTKLPACPENSTLFPYFFLFPWLTPHQRRRTALPHQQEGQRMYKHCGERYPESSNRAATQTQVPPPLPPCKSGGPTCSSTAPEHVAEAQILPPCYIWKLNHYCSCCWIPGLSKAATAKSSKPQTWSKANTTTGLSRSVQMHRHTPGLLPQLCNADAGPKTLVRFGGRQDV